MPRSAEAIVAAEFAGTAIRTSRLTRAVIYAALLFFAFYYMLPLYVMVVNSVCCSMRSSAASRCKSWKPWRDGVAATPG